MDVLLALAFAVGLTYGMVRLARWAIPRDVQQWKRERASREALDPKERRRVNDLFERIAEDLRKKPDD